MRTTIGLIPQNRDAVRTRTGAQEYTPGHQALPAQAAKCGKPANHFLTAVFKPQPADRTNSLYCTGNYKYLYDSAKNYARLLGQHFTLEPDPNDFEAICKQLEALLPENMEIRLYVKRRRIHLKIIDNLDSCTLYYIPCKIIDETEGEFKNILIDFFRLLQYRQKMTHLLDSPHFEMWKGELEGYYAGMGDEPDEEWMEILMSYAEGEISKTLDLIGQKPEQDETSLSLRIGNYTASTSKEKEILHSMKKGLKLLQTGKVLFDYTNGPRLGRDEYPIDADNLFMVVYDDDGVMDCLIEYMNNYAMETGYEFFSSINKTITPGTKSPARPDRFVTDFLEWINDFSYVLYHG